jgi:hypothetical protein
MGGDRKFLVPKYVYSPAGGWWRNPKNWRRNTAFAFGITFAICAPLAYYSAQNEYRPLKPARWIPSQMWVRKTPGSPTERIDS